MRQITRCIRQHTMEFVLKPSKPRRGLIGNGKSIVTCHGFHRNCMSFSMKNSRIAFQITLISALLVWQKCKIWFYRSVISTSKGYLHRKNMPRIATLSVYLLVLKRVRRDIRDSRNDGHCHIVCWQSEADCAESKSDQMCEIRLTKLPYVAQQVGVVHFYAAAEIKGLSCRLRWMDEWRNLLTSTHVGHRLCHVGSRKWRVTKIWGPRCDRD